MHPPDRIKGELRRNNTERVNSFHFTTSRQQSVRKVLSRVGQNSIADIAAATAAAIDIADWFQPGGVIARLVSGERRRPVLSGYAGHSLAPDTHPWSQNLPGTLRHRAARTERAPASCV